MASPVAEATVGAVEVRRKRPTRFVIPAGPGLALLGSPVAGGRTQHGDAGRCEVVPGAEHGVPGPLSERVREAIAEVERGRMPSLAVSPPPAHRAGRQLLIDGDDVDLRITEKPVYDILPGRPEAGLDDDAQLNPDGSGHQPDEGMLKAGGEILASRLAEDHGYAG